MIDLIRKTQAKGVMFISGDVHWGEISKRNFDEQYPLFDVTASGITQDWHNVEPNDFRVGKPFRKNHFGMIEIDWGKKGVPISMKIIDVEGKTQIEHSINLNLLHGFAK